jgi:hypothetical protein
VEYLIPTKQNKNRTDNHLHREIGIIVGVEKNKWIIETIQNNGEENKIVRERVDHHRLSFQFPPKMKGQNLNQDQILSSNRQNPSVLYLDNKRKIDLKDKKNNLPSSTSSQNYPSSDMITIRSVMQEAEKISFGFEEWNSLMVCLSFVFIHFYNLI